MNLLRLRDPEQWPVEVWDIHSVIAKRRALLTPNHSQTRSSNTTNGFCRAPTNSPSAN